MICVRPRRAPQEHEAVLHKETCGYQAPTPCMVWVGQRFALEQVRPESEFLELSSTSGEEPLSLDVVESMSASNQPDQAPGDDAVRRLAEMHIAPAAAGGEIDWNAAVIAGAGGVRGLVARICVRFHVPFEQAVQYVGECLHETRLTAGVLPSLAGGGICGSSCISGGASTGYEMVGYGDGRASDAVFGFFIGSLTSVKPDGRVLVADSLNQCIRVLSADLQQVSTVAGDGGEGHRDGAAAQAQFYTPRGLALLPDSRVLVTELSGQLRMLSADLQQVSTLLATWRTVEASDEDEDEDEDEVRANSPVVLETGQVLFVQDEHSVCMLSADLRQMSTVAGSAGQPGHRDGVAKYALFGSIKAMAVLPDGRVLITHNQCIRVLSADLQQVSTVVGGSGEQGVRDGDAEHALFGQPGHLVVLFDGRVVIEDYRSNNQKSYLRVLSADLQQVSTLVGICGLDPGPLTQLSDGRLLVADGRCIRALAGFGPSYDPSWLKLSLNRALATSPLAVDGSSDVLIRVSAMPKALWRNIFKYL